MALIVLIVRPAVTVDGYHLDRFTAVLDGEVIVTSRQPLLEGARVLLRRGYDPDTRLTIRHAGSDHDSFVPAPIGELAKSTIEETDKRGLRRRPWRPLPDALRIRLISPGDGCTPPRTESAEYNCCPQSSIW